MLNSQYILDIADEISVDLFAGGGGLSTAYEMATGRHMDIAINHNDDAISMHRMNHPQTRHFTADVFEVDPRAAVRGRPVGLLHLSPDCTHHSQASGGQPRNRKIRALSWVGYRWAGQVRPRVITLENVKQVLQWGPLIAKRDKATGRVVTLDMVRSPKTGKMVNRVADKGEQVPLRNQYLVPDPKRAGQTWNHFVSLLEELGYDLKWFRLKADDFGAGTSRDRLFMVARCDGAPIVRPTPTHAKKPAKGLKRRSVAADHLDFTLPCHSIFMSKEDARPYGIKRPLGDKTLERIAAGTYKYVLNASDPFIVNNMANNHPRGTDEPLATILGGNHKLLGVPSIVPATHHDGSDRSRSADDVLPTITGANRGELMMMSPVLAPMPDSALATDELTAPTLIQAAHGAGTPGGVQRWGSGAHDVQEPLGTVHAGGGSFALVAPTLVKFRFNSDGGRLDEPLPTITSGGGSKRDAGAAHAMGVTTAYLQQLTQGGPAHSVAGALPTVTTSKGGEQMLVAASMVPSAHDGLVSAFLAQHNTMPNGGVHSGHDAREPLSTIIGSGSHQNVVAAHLAQLRQHCDAADAREPLPTITAGGEHHAVVQYTLTPEHEAGALRVAAFLMRYHGEGGQWADLRDPLTTTTTRDRLALVTVVIRGTPYVVVDIGLRMLTPRELYRCQGFPAKYIIERGHDGRVFSKAKQVKMCGNSVSPYPAMALIKANYTPRVRESAPRATRSRGMRKAA